MSVSCFYKWFFGSGKFAGLTRNARQEPIHNIHSASNNSVCSTQYIYLPQFTQTVRVTKYSTHSNISCRSEMGGTQDLA